MKKNGARRSSEANESSSSKKWTRGENKRGSKGKGKAAQTTTTKQASASSHVTPTSTVLEALQDMRDRRLAFFHHGPFPGEYLCVCLCVSYVSIYLKRGVCI